MQRLYEGKAACCFRGDNSAAHVTRLRDLREMKARGYARHVVRDPDRPQRHRTQQCQLHRLETFDIALAEGPEIRFCQLCYASRPADRSRLHTPIWTASPAASAVPATGALWPRQRRSAGRHCAALPVPTEHFQDSGISEHDLLAASARRRHRLRRRVQRSLPQSRRQSAATATQPLPSRRHPRTLRRRRKARRDRAQSGGTSQ